MDDHVARDIADIPKVLGLLQSDWASPTESYNRLTALTLTSLLKKRMLLHDSGEHDGTVDLLVTGCEVSLWMGEQFAADLHRAFPKLNIVSLSANKLLAQLGQSFPIPQLNFQFHERSYSLTESPVLLISHSGGTFASLACSNLLKSFTSHIFAVTSEWDTQVASSIRKGVGGRKATSRRLCLDSYVFVTLVGIRPAESCTISVAATHQLLTLLLLHIMNAVRVTDSDGKCKFITSAGSTFVKEEVQELAALNEGTLVALKDLIGEPDEAKEGKAPKIKDTKTSAMLRKQGRKWAQHILEGPYSWILSALYIALTVIAGTTPLSIALFFARRHLAFPDDAEVSFPENVSAGLSCTLDGVPIVCNRIGMSAGAPSYYWVAVEYAVATIDAVIYMFLPWWTTVLLRLVQGRPWLHRVSGRSILIGDVPWVAQSIEAYVSKLFALSYSIASVSVASANPTDHLVHRHTHRVVRGSLLAVGRPDGRLNALASAEATTCLSVNQASSIQNFGVTCESVTIGHSPFKLPLSAQHLTLPSHRPKFFCEAECDTRFAKEGSLDGMSAGGLMGAMEEVQHKTDSLAIGSLRGMSSGSKLGSKHGGSWGDRPSVNSRDSWISMNGAERESVSGPLGNVSGKSVPKSALRRGSDASSSQLVGASFIERLELPFLGAWMKISKVHEGDDEETLARKRMDGEAFTVGDLMAKQRFVQIMYEARLASLQRLVAFFVMFHEMGKQVQDFWPAATFGIFGYDMTRSQSIMRIATTASPVSGAEVRHRILALGEEQTRGWGAMKIQTERRMLKAKGATQEQLMEMVMSGRLSQAQLHQITRERGMGKKKRGGVMGDAGADAGPEGYELVTHEKSDETRALLVNACKASALFAGSSREQLGDASDAMKAVSATAGTDVITQGAADDDIFYIVERGEFSVHLKQANDAEVHRYSSGGSFGELALMYNCPRAATVRCAVEGKLWAIDRPAYRYIMRRAGQGNRDVATAALNLVPALAELDEDQREDLAGALEEVKVVPGEFVVSSGDVGDALYLVKQGTVLLTAPGAVRASQADGGGTETVEATRLTTPSHFGAFSLTGISPTTGMRPIGGALPQWDRSVLIESRGAAAVLLKLSRAKFLERIGPLDDAVKLNRLLNTLRAVPIFRELDYYELRQLAESASLPGAIVYKAAGEDIIGQGEVGDCMWMLRRGTVQVTREVGGQTVMIKDKLEAGAYFGEAAILNDEPRSATITATSDVELTRLGRENLTALLGSMEVVAKRELRRREKEAARARASSFTLDALKKTAPLGAGTFGRVYLVEHHLGDKPVMYALKQMPKHHLVASKQVDHIVSEKEVLFNIDHPFCNQIVAVLSDERSVYMLLEAVLGGELFTRIQKVGNLDVNATRFYATGIASALAHLHGRRIVYRDLKPENVLIDELGYPKIIDFGFAKRLDSPRTWTLCGTPHYLAPEMVTSQGHGFAVDWWSFGVLVYEMLIGTPPFNADSELAIYTLITKNKVHYGHKMNAKAKDLISSLLVTDPLQRLGSGKRADDDVLQHGFLKAAQLPEYLQRSADAPWVPKIKGMHDTSNFEVNEDDFAHEDAFAEDESPQHKRDLAKLEKHFSSM